MTGLTATRVVEALTESVGEERGQHIVRNLGMTRWCIADLGPTDWETVSAYLHALLNLAPMRDSPAYLAHRLILGSLATELRGYARDAGEPVGLEADLRAASSKAEERRVRERIDVERAETVRYYEDVHAHHQAEQTFARPQEDPIEEAPDASQPTETADALAWL